MSEEVKQEGDFKIKKKPGRPRKLNKDKEEVVKINLNKEKDAVSESKTERVVLPTGEESKEKGEKTDVGLQEVGSTHSEEEITEIKEEKKEEVEDKKDISPIIEIGEKELDKSIKPLVDEEPLPPNVQKLVEFMQDTGGTIEDYTRLNADYSKIDNDELLREYYNKTKPHLEADEIDFILEDQFSYNEDYDEEKAIKKKKLAYKEEIVKAKSFLEDLKNKYYEEIKLRPGVTQEQQKAIEFFNKYNEEQKVAQERHGRFTSNTKNFFSDEFKGFNFDVADKKFRYNVNDKESLANKQSNLNNFVGKFFDEKGDLKDYNAYHKAIYAAENADTIANHFYEQGKADAVKDMMAKSKNIDDTPRATSTGDVYVNGLKVKAIDGVDSSKLKLRINKR